MSDPIPMTEVDWCGMPLRDRIEVLNDRIAALELALAAIASASPASRHPHDDADRCACCLGMIDHARDALGHARWPAASATPAGGPDHG